MLKVFFYRCRVKYHYRIRHENFACTDFVMKTTLPNNKDSFIQRMEKGVIPGNTVSMIKLIVRKGVTSCPVNKTRY